MAAQLEAPIWFSSAAACLATFALLLLLGHHLLRRTHKLPPGPKPWPIIGNLNLIGPLPYQSIHALSKNYGPIMHLRLGSKPVVVGSSVEMVEALLKTHDLTFASRPKTTAGKYTFYNYSDILWSPYGPYLRQARRVCFMELFSARSMESSEYIRKEEVNAVMRELHNCASRTILLKEHILISNLNIISRMVFGKKYIEKTENSVVTPEEFKNMVDEFFLVTGFGNIGDFIPWINFLDFQGYVKRMKALHTKFDKFLEHVLEEHNERRKWVKDYVAKDMLDMLLHLSEDPNLEVKLERHNVKAFTLDLITAGTESSAVNVEWAMSELLKNPKSLKEATEELDRVIGRERWVEEKDFVNLPYIEAIVKETMRLHPPAPLLMPRIAREDCNIAGYHIPKGTQMVVNVWSIGRDPSIWENPHEFQPQRFFGNAKAIDVKGRDFELLPFGSGRRMCPASGLGLKLIQASLANLLHGFNWKLPDDMKKENFNMDEIFRLSTTKKVPLEAVAEPRLPLHLYAL